MLSNLCWMLCCSSKLFLVASIARSHCRFGILSHFVTNNLFACHLVSFLSLSQALQMLDNKEVGVFMVRNSSKPGNFALSMRQKEPNPYVQHYLIQQTLHGTALDIEHWLATTVIHQAGCVCMLSPYFLFCLRCHESLSSIWNGTLRCHRC